MMDDLISRRDAINAVSEITTTMSVCTNKDECYGMKRMQKQAITELANLPSVQPDDDKLERCRFEYVNACKILAHRTPDTRKKDIDDAYAVVRALYPIFGEESF